LFFAYAGVEISTGQWSFTLLTEGRGLSPGLAGGLVSSYWGALTLGRVVAALAGHRVGPSALLDVGVLGTVAGTALLWWDPVPAAGAAGLGLTGLGLSGIFPTLVSLTPTRLGTARSTRAVGYQLAAASVGGALLGALAGLVAGVSGLPTIFPYLLATAVLVAVLHTVLVRVSTPRGSGRAGPTAPRTTASARRGPPGTA
ncbi:MAG: MFS transporter, partial [Acidimicrobiales bacterium]